MMSAFKRWSFPAVGVLMCTCLALAAQPPSKQPPAASGKTAPGPDKTGTAPGMDKPGAAQDKATPPKSAGDGSKEIIVVWTYDGVRIEGDFYPPPEGKGKKTPVILLLHAVGKA